MPRRQHSRPSPLTVVAGPLDNDYVPPTPEHRQAADAYLRGARIEGTMAALLAKVTAKFGATHNDYVRLAREAGDASDDWDTIARVIAQDLARAAAADQMS
jgi:hypothetical protein